MNLDKRKRALFQTIAKEHIRTGKPIASAFLAKKYGLSVSPATVRNELMFLEKEALLTHPHTSAGRILTEKGYRYFVDNFLTIRELSRKERFKLERKKNEPKEVAKSIASFSRGAILLGFTKYDFYYTGLSYLFSQPEFINLGLVRNMASIIDHLDEVMAEVFEAISEPCIFLGRDNPFSQECGTVMAKCGNKLFAILGPMRMDYETNLARIKFLKQLYD